MSKRTKPFPSHTDVYREEKQIAELSEAEFSDTDNIPFFLPSPKEGQEVQFYKEPNLQDRDGTKLFKAKLAKATGTSKLEVGANALFTLGESIKKKGFNKEIIAWKYDIAAQTMESLEPKDSIEAQLISQLIALHEHGMHWLGLAMNQDRADFVNLLLNGASKTLARHHETLESLMKYRRQGEQRVHVEHVHIHHGAKAIVGVVNPIHLGGM